MAVEDLRVSGGVCDVHRQGGMAENVDERQGVRRRGVRPFRKTMAGAEFLHVRRDVPFVRKRAALPWARLVDFTAVVVVKKDAGSVCAIRKYQRFPVLGQFCIFLDEFVQRNAEEFGGSGHFVFLGYDEAFPFAALTAALTGEIFHSFQ